MRTTPIVILGAGPAGLSAAYECIKQGIRPLVLEKTDTLGGIARTEFHNGYHFDMGGHRFFTKIDPIQKLWEQMLGDEFLTVSRMSRIYFRDRFFNYPLSLSNALFNLGVMESIRIAQSYVKAQMLPNKKDETFEQWVSNRFGSRLYENFFKTYTEKVWGIPCDQIQSDWAAQRIKGLSLVTAVTNALLGSRSSKSLIDSFHYPARGPGMMWRRFRETIEDAGGEVRLNAEVTGVAHDHRKISAITIENGGRTSVLPVEKLISSIPITKLIARLNPAPAERVRNAAQRLSYRAFIIVCLIVDRPHLFPDQWIYVHSPDVKVGRIQNFKNWSAQMVPDPATTSIGMEYFCNVGDDIWNTADEGLAALATQELSKLGFAGGEDVIDYTVVRQPYAYPVYDEAFKTQLPVIKAYLSGFENLQTIGRNGMHRYNNMDHSMLTGILAVQNICGGRHNLWKINEEEEYLEEAKPTTPGRTWIPEKVLNHAFARMDKLALGVSLGSVAGLLVFLATLWLLVKGGDTVGPHMSLLGQYFKGYSVSVQGAFIAFGYCFFCGLLYGWLFAYLRNLVFAFYLYRVKRRTEISTLNAFFEYL